MAGNRFTCPRCQTVVEAAPGQQPVCPNCGFGAPPIPAPAVAASPASPNPACPKCGSMSFSMDKQGYGWGKGATGFCCCGPLGAFLGGAGSKRSVRVCNNCGTRVKL